MVEVEYLFFVEKLGRKKNSKKKHLLTVQLPAHGQERRLPEKVRRIVDLPVGGGAGQPAEHDGRGRGGSGGGGGGGSTYVRGLSAFVVKSAAEMRRLLEVRRL